MEAVDLLVPPMVATDLPSFAPSASAPTVEELKTRITQTVTALVAWVISCQTLTFYAFETQLVPQVLTVGGCACNFFSKCVKRNGGRRRSSRHQGANVKARLCGNWARSSARSAMHAPTSTAAVAGITLWILSWVQSPLSPWPNISAKSHF